MNKTKQMKKNFISSPETPVFEVTNGDIFGITQTGFPNQPIYAEPTPEYGGKMPVQSDYGEPVQYEQDILIDPITGLPLNNYGYKIYPSQTGFPSDQIELPVESQPIYVQPTPENGLPAEEQVFIDDIGSKMPVQSDYGYPAQYEVPVEPSMPPEQIEQPVERPVERIIHPADQLFIDDNMPDQPIFSNDIQPQTAVAPSSTEPTFRDDVAPVAPESVAAPLPTKPVSKNLTPYIYAGLGIIAILIVARMVTKK